VPRLVILIVVALSSRLPLRVVAVIVKMDDVGLYLTATASRSAAGRPGSSRHAKLLSLLSHGWSLACCGGGHILRAGSDQLGWHTLEGVVGTLWSPRVPSGLAGRHRVSAVIGLVSDRGRCSDAPAVVGYPIKLVSQPVLIIHHLGAVHTNGVPLALSPASVSFPV